MTNSGSGRGGWADLLQRIFFVLIVRPFLVVVVGLKVRGREHLDLPSPFILVANHTSHLDTASLLALFPLSRLKEIRPVAAADYFERSRFVSILTRTLFHTLPIVRRREEMTAEGDPRHSMLEALDAGYSLILFPEGTRGSSQDTIGRFKGGIAHLVTERPNVPVIPVHLRNMGRSLPKGTWVPVPIFCEVHVGAARCLSGSSSEVVGALERAVLELKE